MTELIQKCLQQMALIFPLPFLILLEHLEAIAVIPAIAVAAFVSYLGKVEAHDAVTVAEERTIVLQRVEACPKRRTFLAFLAGHHAVVLFAFSVGEGFPLQSVYLYFLEPSNRGIYAGNDFGRRFGERHEKENNVIRFLATE